MLEPSVYLQDLPKFSRFIFRGRPSAVAAAKSAFGVALPDTACTAAQFGGRAALWLGPDEWLLLAPESEAKAIAAAFDAGLKDLPHSLVEISARQIALELSGTDAALALNAGCPLDFDRFPVGGCTRTMLGKAEITLWRRAADRFHLEVWRSFADYVRGFLLESGREFGIQLGDQSREKAAA